MREIYTGSSFSRNKYQGNFYWPGQKDGTKFDRLRPHYLAHIEAAPSVILIYFCFSSSSSYVTGECIFLLRNKIPKPLISEWLLFRTQQDLGEFLHLNQLVQESK